MELDDSGLPQQGILPISAKKTITMATEVLRKKRLFPQCNNWIAIAFTYTLGINVDASIANLAQYPNDISFAIKLQYFMEWMNPYFLAFTTQLIRPFSLAK